MSAILPPLKQIRFVNNEGQPPPKRRRINAACLTCRKRKTRCDGKRPLCSTCTQTGHECMGYAEEMGEGKSDGEENKRECERAHIERHVHDSAGEERQEEEHMASHEKRTIPSPHESERVKESTGNYFGEPQGTASQKNAPSDFGEYRHSTVYSSDAPIPIRKHTPVRQESHRVPYFRYFGPTAIVPGFKQMVVSVREHRRNTGTGSSISLSPGFNTQGTAGPIYSSSTSYSGVESRASIEMPVYDPNDHFPVSRLIIHLVHTFFTHLGSNFPFLRQEKFFHKVENKRAEPILVDAVCALAARFSDHPLLTSGHDAKSEYGQVFAQRAKAAVVDTFPCPTVAAVQACLLLAYEGFGANQDSALWMFLGCAIRMAIDLGLQKLDGVRHQDPKDPAYRRQAKNDAVHVEKEVEQERTDTLWAVFMLDRVISSGTGRPVTLRDEHFELTFPELDFSTENGWPNPFPVLIQIIHLYGRVSDLLNNMSVLKDVTKKIDGLSDMEKDLTLLYQKLDLRLTFNAENFQHYVKSGDGTNFILVHFWFHTLIMLLHQPVLMPSFEGQILQLLPNSRELSMSSAKTITDILAFAELIDPRSFIGNPFTSQPMYIAACAFLKESAAHTSSQPTSRDTSPPTTDSKATHPADTKPDSNYLEQKQKHSLLASAANQNYQRCYKALQQLENYWAGARYILVALDQKAKGIWDPETYTEQEYESIKHRSNTLPNWRRTHEHSRANNRQTPRIDSLPGSPGIDPSQAIGWSLTGTTNSPSSNLTFMYQNMNDDHTSQSRTKAPSTPTAGNMIYDPIRGSLPEIPNSATPASFPPRYIPYSQRGSSTLPPVSAYTLNANTHPVSTADADMLLGLQASPYSTSTSSATFMPSPSNRQELGFQQGSGGHQGARWGSGAVIGLGDVMMESREIDMSTLGGDMVPWLEYLPQDMLSFFDSGNENRGVDMGVVSGRG